VTDTVLHVRRLTPTDAEAFVAMRRESLERDPLSFAASPGDDRISGLDAARAALGDDSQALFGAFLAEELAGIVSLVRHPKRKLVHRAAIYGMYVREEARGRGLGRALLDAAVAQAREWGLRQLHLSATDAAPGARALYEAAGFRHWGTEPGSLLWEGRLVDEHHLVLKL